MKTIRSKTGPFFERPHFKLAEIEEMCTEELRRLDLYPSIPEPIRIDRFVEKRFKVIPRYEILPDGVLGFTKFGRNGVETIVLSSALDLGTGRSNERRLRTTLAHEAGHGLMHSHLFALGTKPKSLFGEGDESPEILCRDVAGEAAVARGYDGRWWEFQANKAIGGLLMPRYLVELALQKLTEEIGSLGQRSLPPGRRESAIRELSEAFDVNPAVARIRLEGVFPRKNDAQLAL